MSGAGQQHGDDSFSAERKVRRSAWLNDRLSNRLFDFSFAYVPSIRITPTTRQVRPLKLVKKHRLLREQNFNDPFSFALVEIRDESNRDLYSRDFCALRKLFHRYLSQPLTIYKMSYRYLHHSMSQVKEKQFWFLNSNYSTANVLSWIGNFDHERIVAKHAARIALALTSTDPSIQVGASVIRSLIVVLFPRFQLNM